MPWTRSTDVLTLDRRCPWCKRHSVVYDGTYFCTEPPCDWGMSEDDFPVRPWLESLIRIREADGRDVRWERYYLLQIILGNSYDGPPHV